MAKAYQAAVVKVVPGGSEKFRFSKDRQVKSRPFQETELKRSRTCSWVGGRKFGVRSTDPGPP